MKGILPVYKDSFFCGFNRKDGLQLQMFYEKGLVCCEINIDNRFEGYTDVLHGGIIFGILDVIIWYAIFMETKKICMTRKTETEFFKPVLCGAPYTAKGQFLRIEGKDVHATAWIEDKNNEVYASVYALFREARNISYEDFINKFDFSKTTPSIKKHFLSILNQ
ncbi:MAG TPA: PaaI family thioesterase [Syntrophorhabdaceae bacterium]|nr:PaaI family thioesterase [Syntrophorhabdaceae bacterium]